MRARTRWAAGLVALAITLLGASAAGAAEPIRLGFSMALTGGVAANGKQVLAALELWRDDVNGTGGLLGRPVELVYYDDQSNPATVPGIYTKLIEIDKVDLVIGPYATNMIAAAMPILMQHGETTVGFLGLAANSSFHYGRYFSMAPTGEDSLHEFSRGFFELALQQSPRPKTVALVGADAEYGKNGTDGARDNAKAAGLEIVYDRRYPPATTDFSSIARAIQATTPDLVYDAAYPPDTVGFIHAADEIGLRPKMLGGSMIGVLATVFRMQLGPLLNGLVVSEVFPPSFDFPGLRPMLAKYQAKAAANGTDPLGYAFVPFGYAGAQIIGAAVTATKSLDHEKLAAYIHSHSFATVAGDLAFGPDGEWAKPRDLYAQFHGVKDSSLDQFRTADHETILWPAEYQTGTMIYPYEKAK